MEFERLDTDSVLGEYHDSDGIVRVTYRGVLTADVTRVMYGWLGRLIAQNGGDISRTRGSIYDFRQVIDFDSRNFSTAQSQSANLKTQVDRIDLSQHPVALVVNTIKQEQFVKLTMQVVGQEKRQRIVRSIEDAEAFIAAFHRQHTTEPST